MKQSDIDLFLVENEVLVINKKEVRGIPVLRRIIERDKGGKLEGDYDGRRKFVAFKELLFIYLMYSPYSIYDGLDEKIKREKVLIDLDGIYKGWKEDEELNLAIEYYKDCIYSSPIFHAYNNAYIGINGIGEDLKFFNDRARYIRSKIKLHQVTVENSKLDADVEEAHNEIGRLTNELLDLNGKIQKITEKLPNSFDNLKNLYDRLKIEKQQDTEIHGGGKLGNREA